MIQKHGRGPHKAHVFSSAANVREPKSHKRSPQESELADISEIIFILLAGIQLFSYYFTCSHLKVPEPATLNDAFTSKLL